MKANPFLLLLNGNITIVRTVRSRLWHTKRINFPFIYMQAERDGKSIHFQTVKRWCFSRLNLRCGTALASQGVLLFNLAWAGRVFSRLSRVRESVLSRGSCRLDTVSIWAGFSHNSGVAIAHRCQHNHDLYVPVNRCQPS